MVLKNTADQVIRLTNGRWARGVSGNPGGRPRAIGSARDAARAHTLSAISTLAEIAEHGGSESARVAAAIALLDRGWGRPPLAIALDPRPVPDIAQMISKAHREAREVLARPLLLIDADGVTVDLSKGAG